MIEDKFVQFRVFSETLVCEMSQKEVSLWISQVYALVRLWIRI